MRKIARKLGSVAKRAAVIGGTVWGLATTAQAQITNSPAGVGATISGGISTVYDAAVTIGVGAIAVGMAVYFVRKGLKTRA